MSTEHASTSAPIVSAQTAALIPIQHHEAFHNLTKEEQDRVSLLVSLLQAMETAPEGKIACSQRLALEISQRGYSAKNLQALYQAWRNAKCDWRVLVRNYRGPAALPVEFVEFLRMKIEQNARCASQAMAQIKAAWAHGESIPGYGTWREWYLTEWPDRDVPESYPLGVFPAGWSKSNLYTKQSSRAERMLKRRGFAAAKRYLPHVMRDMSGLRFLELIIIDDFESDVVVLARHPETGRYELCTCTGLLAMDAATRTIVGFGLKPRFKSEDGKRIAITRADVQSLLYGVFSEHGLPRDYRPTILAENAAAAITTDFELALQNLLGVQVARTGLIADKTLRNGFMQGGGKPWEKGVIESTFNLMHNMAGAMPGQKGASYQLKPADLEAKILYAEKLIAIEGLAPEVAQELHVPFLKFEEALDGYTKIFRAMEQREKHQLQGFSEIVDFWLPDGSELVPQAALIGVPSGELIRYKPEPRMESPAERKAKLIRGVEFVKIAEHALALLLLTPKQVELRNHKITFVHGAGGFTFADADSPVLSLPEGTKLLGYFDGANARVLHCTDLQGRYVGSVKRRGRVDIRDQDAINAEAGEITRLITKHVLNPVRERHAGENAQLALADAHNRALLEKAGVKPEDMPARLVSPAEKKSLSAKLGAPAPARETVAANQNALAASVAAEGQKAAETVAREIELRADAERLTTEDIAAANDNAGAQPAEEFSPEEISNLLSDDVPEKTQP